MKRFKDAEHLLRLAAVFAAGTLTILLVRSAVVPRSFGQYGHYRGAVLGEIAARPIHFAGHQTCESCHSDILEKKSSGKHANVNCEACHGPLANHANDPSIDPGKPDVATLCIRCHTASAAHPQAFPQIDPGQHFTGVACNTCHQPHHPELSAGGSQ